MANLSVKTTFNTKLNLDTDSLAKRIFAYAIDIVVLLVYWLLLLLFFSLFNVDLGDAYKGDSDRIAWGWISLLSLPILFYTLFSEVVSGGYTIGKYAVGAKVIKINGFQPTFVDFFIRWIFRMVDIYFFFIVAIIFGGELSTIFSVYTIGLVGLMAISRSKSGQRIGDKIAGTAVIKSKVKHSMNITILKELSADYKPTFTQVIKLSDNDARIIKETYENAKRMNNTKLISKLVEKLEGVMNIKNTMDQRVFIETVLKDFNYYTQNM
ncbi:MAG: putative RDD family membrane protein YckC [Bacteroidia bacterium]|jgi:uncharacterized RDD family membrane protein YckC